MALTLDWKEVRFWTRNTEHPDSVRVSEPVEPGTLVAPSGTDDELYGPGNGDGSALAITRGLSARRTIAAVRRGEVDLGAGIQALNDGAGIFATADALAEVVSLVIAAGVSADGTVTVTLNGIAYNVAVAAADTTVAAVAAKIRAATFPTWTAGGTGATVTFTATTTGVRTGANSYSPGSTPATGTMTTTTEGTAHGGVLTDVATSNKRIGTVRTVNGRRLVRLEL